MSGFLVREGTAGKARKVTHKYGTIGVGWKGVLGPAYEKPVKEFDCTQ